MDFGYWALEERATGTFVGEVGFADFKRDASAAARGLPELGWVLAGVAHGKGYATEAVRAAIAWGEAHLAAKRTICLIDAENRPSLRVARKCGYAIAEETAFAGRRTLLFARNH